MSTAEQRLKWRIAAKMWRDKHPEEARARSRKNNKRIYDNNPEAAQLRINKCKAANPEHYKGYYHQRNLKPELRAHKQLLERKWRKKNPEHAKEINLTKYI